MSNASYSTYQLNKPAPAVLASLVGISLIGWVVQSVQIRFKPYRINILLLVSHLTVFVQLTIRAAYSDDIGTATNAFIASGILLAIGERMIILSNYAFLIQTGDPKSGLSQFITRATLLVAIISAIITGIGAPMLYNAVTIDGGFHCRQVAAALILSLTVFFYPIWLAMKSTLNMKKHAIVLLMISSLSCLIVAVYITIISIPQYYYQTTEEEYWFYIFQITPTIIALLAWTIFHPKRSLEQTEP